MTTLEITLDDSLVERLRQVAASEQVSIESLIASAAAERADAVRGVSPEFEALAAELVSTYRPLLDRLA